MRLLNVDCRLLIALLIAPLITNQSTLNNQHSTIQVASPNGLLSFDLSRSTDARLTYTVKMGGDVVIEPSALGIIVDGKNLGDRVESLTKAGESVRIDERYPWLGVHSTAVNRCLATAASVTHSASRTAWIIEARACDDGIAFRYVVPGDARSARTVSETTSFRVPAGSMIWSHDFEGHYEGVHVRRDIGNVGSGLWAATPLTVKLPASAGYASIAESGLAGYAGMALRADGRRSFEVRLGDEEPISYPFFLRYLPDEIAQMAQPTKVTGTITTPWRVVVAGRTLNDLVNADIIHNVAPPPDPAIFPDGVKTSWIRPGRAVWRYLDGGDNTFDGIKHFSALAGELGFEHHVVEGIWERWSDAQLREFVEDARSRGVGIWLWKTSKALATAEQQRAFFARCRQLGVVGAKIDFFDHEAKDMIDRYQSILREAAAARIMVNFHGANKPAGEARTWPNELTREGVKGLEYRNMEAWARHNTTLPFTRYLAGAGDYTPVVFGDRRKETSWAHQIATAAVFTSPLLVYGAHPQSLLDNPAAEIIKSLPSIWDETIVLPMSEIGEVAAFARRRGETWFVAVLNGGSARTLRIDLGFLRAGRYDALIARDKMNDPAAVVVEQVAKSRGDTLIIELRPAGGYIARLTPSD
jgi:alpha-glucosidase